MGIQVKAIKPIFSSKGLLLAPTGAYGYIVEGIVPAERKNYLHIAIRWGTNTKHYWTDPTQIKLVKLKKSLDEYVVYAVEPIGSAAPKLSEFETCWSQDFGEILKLVRKTRGYGQVRLAQLLTEVGYPVSQTTISFWQRRTTCPAGTVVAHLSFILKVPPIIFLLEPSDCSNAKSQLEAAKTVLGEICKELE